MEKQCNYTIVQEATTAKLISAVIAHMKNGWIVQGGISFYGSFWCQAMVKKTDENTEQKVISK